MRHSGDRDPRHFANHSPETINLGSANGQEDSKDTSSTPATELRQKVMESLAEKKKQAALFMNKEAEGAKDQSGDTRGTPGNSVNGGAEALNPERDAAVDALLATFGTTRSRAENEEEQQCSHSIRHRDQL